MKFYPHNISDFIADTSRLPDSVCMAYLRMIWKYYDSESPLENDADAIAFDIGANASDVHQILKRFFFLHDDGFWHHARCDKVILDFYGKSDKARESANARWKNANALRSQSERTKNTCGSDATHNPEPITNNPEEKQKSNGAPPKGDAKKADIAMLVEIGVDEQTAIDFLKVRKAKRAPLTVTALNRIAAEAAKANITTATAIRICAERSWQGFNHSWDWQTSNAARASPAQSYAAQRDADRKATVAELTGANKRQGDDHGRVIDATAE